jgi:hypothetical protein
LSAPDDANDLRGFHFRRLLGRPLTWIVISASVLAAGVAAGSSWRARLSTRATRSSPSKSAAELDAVRTATATVARRLREESLETA